MDSERGSPRPWLFTTLRNVLIDEWRARKVRPEIVTDEVPEIASPDHADAAVQSWLVADALRQLSQQHREVLLECYYPGVQRRPGRAAARHTHRHREVQDLLRLASPPARARGEGGNGMTDRFTHDAGPYVLGALPPEDRRAFEEHLAVCGHCRSEVQEFAGLPGLLSRLPAGELPAVLQGSPSRRRRSRCCRRC